MLVLRFRSRYLGDKQPNRFIGTSLVAVHGLNLANVGNHAELTWTSPRTNKLWLRDFLPRRLTRTRVLLFGYNANVAVGTSTAGVMGQANNLLNWLMLRREVNTRSGDWSRKRNGWYLRRYDMPRRLPDDRFFSRGILIEWAWA